MYIVESGRSSCKLLKMNMNLILRSLHLLLLTVFTANAQEVGVCYEKIIAADRKPDDWFGFSTSMSKDFAIVGALMKEKLKNGIIVKESGAVFFFRRDKFNHWKEVQKIEGPGATPYQWFGCSVSISGDYAIVGANGDHDALDSTTQVRKGAAYLFKRNEQNKWIEIQKLVLKNRSPQDAFGKIVFIQGNYIAVSATGVQLDRGHPESKGCVFIYNLLYNEKGNPVDTIISPDKESADFGESIGLYGNQLVVTGGKTIYLYQRGASDKWVQTQVLQPGDSSNSGRSIHVSVCKDYLLVGQAGDYSPFEGKDIPLTDSVYQFASINPSGDFKSIYVINDKHLRDSFGISASRFKKGAQIVESAEIRKKRMAGAGTAYIYHKDKNGKWILAQQVYASDRKYDQHFGNSVSISDSLAIIGAFGDKLDGQEVKNNFYAGAAYVFKLDKSGEWKLERKLTSNQRAVWTKFGFSVGAFDNTAIIGSRFESGDILEQHFCRNAGAVYIYKH